MVAAELRFLNQFCRRMDRLGFPPHDPLWPAAMQARHAFQDLHLGRPLRRMHDPSGARTPVLLISL
jgi:hypothetical protein